jgi:ankyrin repeat protein
MERRSRRPPPPSPYLDKPGTENDRDLNVFNFRSSNSSNMLPPRPGTASSIRPKTALTTPDVDGSAVNNTAILQRALNSDSLLRILDEKKAYTNNEMIMMAELGDVSGIAMLLSGGDVDISSCRGLAGYTPLHHACNRGHLAVVSEILKIHLSFINTTNDTGETSLHLAVYAGNMTIVEQLLDHGADIGKMYSCLYQR